MQNAVKMVRENVSEISVSVKVGPVGVESIGTGQMEGGSTSFRKN